MASDLDRQITALRHGDHLCLVYDDFDEQMATIVPFFRTGLARGDCCVYIADDRTVDQVALALASAGIEVSAERERGALLLLTKRDVYLRSGEFDPASMIAFLRQTTEEIIGRGFGGMCATGEMTWALGPETGCDRLIEYEARLNHFFPESRAVAICQYSRRRFSPEIVRDVLRTHPMAIVGGDVCPNLYYEPPEMVLGETSEDRRVAWMIGQLRKAYALEVGLRDRARQVEALYEATRSVGESLDLESVLATVLDAARRLFEADRAAIWHLEESGNYTCPASFGLSASYVETICRYFRAVPVDIQAIERHARSRVTDTRTASALAQEEEIVTAAMAAEGICTVLAVPLLRQGTAFGTLALYHDRPRQYAERDRQIVQALANQAAVAIENARLYQAAREQANEVRRLNAELEARVAERTAQLEMAVTDLAAANKELESFSYSVSHDLRAPLRALAGFSRILVRDYAPDLTTEAREYLDLIRANAQQMGRLVDDLLAFSRFSRQPLNKQPVAMTNLVHQVLADLVPDREGRQVEVTIASLPPSEGDPGLLRQVFANLLGNALKFTRGREVTTIEVGCRAESGENVYYVRDNGVGFDMRYVDQLFGVFQRLHRGDEYEGTGAGLAIVQRIIHRHGGRIWAEAAVDRGATFFFTLEGGQDEERSPAASVAAGSSSSASPGSSAHSGPSRPRC